MIELANDRIDTTHIIGNDFDVQKIHRAVMTMFANQTKFKSNSKQISSLQSAALPVRSE